MIKKIKTLIAATVAAFSIKHDPVKGCSVNKEHGCSHVDGYLCNSQCSNHPKVKESETAIVHHMDSEEFKASCEKWDNRQLGASPDTARRCSQEKDDALQDALGLPRKVFK